MSLQLPLTSKEGTAALTRPVPTIHSIHVATTHNTWEPIEEIGYFDQTGWMKRKENIPAVAVVQHAVNLELKST